MVFLTSRVRVAVGIVFACALLVAHGQDGPQPTEEQRKEIAALIAQLPGADMGSRMKAMRAHKKLLAIGRVAVPQLIEAVKSKDASQRLWAGAALGEMGDPRAKEALLPLLTDPNGQVRQVMVWHTRRWFGDPRFLEAASDLIVDKNPDVAKWAQRSVSEHDKALVTRKIMGQLKDKDPATRESALAALEERLPKKRYGKLLLERLEKDPSPAIRGKAFKGLLGYEDLRLPVSEVLVGWLEKLPDDWSATDKAKSRKLARLALRQFHLDPFKDRNIPENESPQETAKRWRHWLDTQKAAGAFGKKK